MSSSAARVAETPAPEIGKAARTAPRFRGRSTRAGLMKRSPNQEIRRPRRWLSHGFAACGRRGASDCGAELVMTKSPQWHPKLERGRSHNANRCTWTNHHSDRVVPAAVKRAGKRLIEASWASETLMPLGYSFPHRVLKRAHRFVRSTIQVLDRRATGGSWPMVLKKDLGRRLSNVDSK
jgi:hypothetical protein